MKRTLRLPRRLSSYSIARTGGATQMFSFLILTLLFSSFQPIADDGTWIMKGAMNAAIVSCQTNFRGHSSEELP